MGIDRMDHGTFNCNPDGRRPQLDQIKQATRRLGVSGLTLKYISLAIFCTRVCLSVSLLPPSPLAKLSWLAQRGN